LRDFADDDGVAGAGEEEDSSRPHMVQASKVPEYVNWYEQGKVSKSDD